MKEGSVEAPSSLHIAEFFSTVSRIEALYRTSHHHNTVLLLEQIRFPQTRMTQGPKKLLDQVRDAIRLKHYAYSSEKTHVYWPKRFVLYHDKQHPQEMAEKEINEFLTYLAVEEHVAALTKTLALSTGTVCRARTHSP